jgi:hypothetical protein
MIKKSKLFRQAQMRNTHIKAQFGAIPCLNGKLEKTDESDSWLIRAKAYADISITG